MVRDHGTGYEGDTTLEVRVKVVPKLRFWMPLPPSRKPPTFSELAVTLQSFSYLEPQPHIGSGYKTRHLGIVVGIN